MQSRRRTPLLPWLFGAALAACGGSSQGGHENTSSSSPSESSGAASTNEDAGSAGSTTSSSESASSDAGESTASSGSADSSAGPSTEGSNEPDVAMHAVSQPGAHGYYAGVDIERRDDGTLLFRGQNVGRMSHGQIYTMDGQQVPMGGRMFVGPRARREHFEPQPDGTIRTDHGTLSLDPSGDVMIARPHHAPEPVHLHIDGYRPEARASAETLVIYGIMKADLASR